MDPKLLMVMRRFCVKEIKWESPNIFTLRLAPDGGEPMFSFVAGQWVHLSLLNPDGTAWGRAAFSVASAPDESGEQFELGIKVYGEFTKRASQLVPGDIVGIQGPFGVFVVPEGASSIILFAGGIGISPLRSMIRSLWLRRAPTQVTLFYSNKTIAETAYFEEFIKMAKEWPAFHPVFLLTSQAPANWDGETGRLNQEILKHHVSDFSQQFFLMCGPDGFMDTIKGLLEKEGVDIKKRLKKESFG